MTSQFVVTTVALLLVGLLLSGPAAAQRLQYRSIDGRRNNLEHPEWGAADTEFIRLVPAAYTNRSSLITGADRPSPRAISLALMETNYPDKKRFMGTLTSDFVTYVGHFYDHELDKTLDGRDDEGTEAAPIPVPKGDPFFDPKGLGNLTLPFTRSAYNTTSTSPYRQTINIVTAFVDGSLVYGSSQAVLSTLRAYKGGRMKTTDDPALGPMLPNVGATNLSTTYMANDAGQLPATAIKAAGDKRANVNPLVTSLQTLWLREHNRLADELAKAHPDWNDETLFQEARKWNIAYLQRVCFYEYVPAIGIALPQYKGYNATVNPSIDNFFSTVAYRYGHSEVTDVLLRIDDEGNEVPQGHLLLHTAYFNPSVGLYAGIDPLLRGMSMRVQGLVEPRFSQSVQNFLFGLPGVNGTDLFARDIQRGRDHGIPDYNTCRKAFGLPPVTNFTQLTNDTSIAEALTKLYGTPDKCDAFVCGLAEKKLPASHFGPLFNASLSDQYLRVRDGDWYYFENNATDAFTDAEIAKIKSTSLRDIILRNTGIKVLPQDIWHVNPDQPWPTPAAAAAAAGSNASGPPSGGQMVTLAGGRYGLGWRFLTEGGNEMVEFTVTVKGSGWVGLGVAASPSSFMTDADIIMARVGPDGSMQVEDMWATTFAPPTPDTALGCSNDVKLVSANRTAGGSTTVTFRRPLAATDPRCDRAIVKDASNVLIYAYNPDSDDIKKYHGSSNRGATTLTLSSSGASGPAVPAAAAAEVVSSGASSSYLTMRTHGILMATAFCLLLPLAFLMIKLKNAAQVAGSSPALVQTLFYAHILCNATAVVLAAAALGLNFSRLKGLDYRQVPISHGTLGVAVVTLLFVQVLYPWMRPKPAPLTLTRRVWEVVHTGLGRSIFVLGLVNVAIGIHLITTYFGGSAPFFVLLAAVPVATLTIIGTAVDRANWQMAKKRSSIADEAAESESLPSHSKNGAMDG